MFKLAPIEEAYQRLTYGYDEPDQLRANLLTVEELNDTLYAIDQRSTGQCYHDARIIVNSTIPLGTVELRNTKWMKQDTTEDKRNSVARVSPPRY